MALQNYDLSDMQMDVLKEIGNIGSGNAATSLSTMLQKPIWIEVPQIRLLEYDEVTKALGGPENMIVGMLLTLSKDVSGMMMFLLQKDFAHMAINALMGETLLNFDDVDEMTLSALQEVGNIMAASYVNAIAQLTGMTIDISVPALAIDMAGAILSVPAIHFANISDKIVFIEDQFSVEAEKVTSHVLMIPDVASLEKIMINLGIEI